MALAPVSDEIDARAKSAPGMARDLDDGKVEG
jgi:hypothetical protein